MSEKKPTQRDYTKIEQINEDFFGKEKTHRYLLDIYRECAEKLLISHTLADAWLRTKGAHEHTPGRNCNQCVLFFQIYDSCVDSLFLHLRLLFSREESNLADSFLKAVEDLTLDDFKAYYSINYEYDLTSNELNTIKPLPTLAGNTIPKLSKLYIKRIEPYQSYAFHRPKDGRYYEVTTTRTDGEGIKYVTHNLKSKFKKDLWAATQMLNLLSDVIHMYLKVSSTYYHTLKIYPQNYPKEILSLIGVEVGEEVLSIMLKNITQHTKKMVHLLECSGGLNSHHGLIFKKLTRARSKEEC